MRYSSRVERELARYRTFRRGHADFSPLRLTVAREVTRRQFLGYVGSVAKYAAVAPILVYLIDRHGGGIIQTLIAAEQVIERPAGHYPSLAAFMDQGAGTDANPKRYRPQAGAVVTIEPGTDHVNLNWTILDGRTGAGGRILIVPDGSVLQTNRKRSGIYDILSSNIVIDSVHIIGTHKVHYGYAWDGTAYCDEGAVTAFGADGLPQGAAIESIWGRNVTFRNCVFTGVKNCPDSGVRGEARYEGCYAYYAESNGGITGTGTLLEMDGCVYWQNPNHGISSDKASGGRVDVRNSIFGPTQEVTGIGGFGNRGCDEFVWIGNTVYCPSNYLPNWGERDNHCGHTSGPVISGPDGEVRVSTTIKNNCFRMAQSANVAAIEWRAASGNLDNGTRDVVNFNLYHNANGNQTIWRFDGLAKTWAQIQALGWEANGKANPGNIATVPLFANAPPDYDNPQPVPGTESNHWGQGIDVEAESVASFRARFTQTASSPGKNAGDDGLDMGYDGRRLGAVAIRRPRSSQLLRLRVPQ